MQNAKVDPQMRKEGQVISDGTRGRVAYHQTVYRLYESCISRRARDIALAEEGRLQKLTSDTRWGSPGNIAGPQSPVEFSPTSPLFAAPGYDNLDSARRQQVRAQAINTALLNCVCHYPIEDAVSYLEMTLSLKRD